MPTQQREHDKVAEQHRRETLNALIAGQVLHGLGRPDFLHRIKVHSLWESFYRVNVLIGEDAVSLKVANSYFLKADSEGKIVESTPKISRPKESQP